MASFTQKCPDCAARMKPDTDNGRMVCVYCGHIALLERQVSAAASREPDIKANVEQETDTRKGLALANRLTALIQPLRKLDTLEIALKGKADALAQSRKNLENHQAMSSFTKILWLPAIGFVLVYLLGSSQKDQALAIILGLILAVLLLIPGLLFRGFRTARLRSAISQAQKAYDKAKLQLSQFEQNYDFDLVPAEYRAESTLEELIQILKTGRADTMNRAFDLFEERQHRRTIATLQQEQVELQRELLKAKGRDKNPKVISVHHEETSVGKELLKGAAWAAGSMIVSGLLKKKR